LSTIPEEARLIRDAMSKITGAKYEIRDVLPKFRSRFYDQVWYVLASQLEQTKLTAFAHTAWEDPNRHVNLQSMSIGSTTEWTEYLYGEEALDAVMKLGSEDFQTVKKELSKRYPKIGKRLDKIEGILTDVSSKHRVGLYLRGVGGDESTALFIEARFEIRVSNSADFEKALKQAVLALKDAWDRIANAKAGWLKKVQLNSGL